MASQFLAAVYDTCVEARDTVVELEAAGVPSSDISLVARHGRVSYDPPVGGEPKDDEALATRDGASIGAAVGGGAGLLAGRGGVAIQGLGPVLAAGWLVATAIGAVAGAATGGLIGVLTGQGISDSNARLYAESVRRSGTLVTGRANEARPAEVDAILHRHASADPVGREYDYAAGGWDHFDPQLPPDVRSEAARRRM
jgi:hypothetical protein